MSTRNLLLSQFKYKAWSNAALFAEMQTLDDATHPSERLAAVRLLNHIYVVDRIFAAHLTGVAHGYAATNTDETPTLEALHFAASETDQWYVDYVTNVSDAALAESVEFTFTDGLSGRMSREEMLAHVVAHGAYHRGGVGRYMAAAGVPPPRDLYTIFLHTSEPQRRARA
ncbi:MAG: DinB family protein [Burkholderiales bacterium]|nr:DinB family protein [Burkholderiales bacterium]